MKNLFYLILLVAIAALAYFMLMPAPKSTLNTTESSFAIKDTAAIKKVEIHHPDFRKLSLSRSDDSHWWHVNNKWLAYPDRVELILETFYRWKVDKPIAQSALASVKKGMKNSPTTITVWGEDESKPLRTYILGPQASHKGGNFMQLNDSENPFLVKIPGLDVHFSGRFAPKIANWRFPRVFDHEAHQIAKVKAEYPLDPKRSFEIEVINTDSFQVKSLSGVVKNKAQNKGAIKRYLHSFDFINAEAFENEYNLQDSLKQTTPYCLLSMTDTGGKEHNIKVHYMLTNKRTKQQFTPKGEPIPYDSDRYFAYINEERDLVIIQDFVFGKLFKSYDEFLAK